MIRRILLGAALVLAMATPAMAEPGMYTNATLDNMDYHGRDLHGVSYINTSLRGANFENTNLSGATLTNVDLSGAKLNGANLSGATLTNVIVVGTQFINVDLSNTNLYNTDMSTAITQATQKAPAPVAATPAPVTQAVTIQKALTAAPKDGPAKIDLTINFDFNSDKLTDQGRAQVAQIAEALKSMGGSKILVQGHTDNVGTDAYNQDLSDRRARSVVNELATIHHVAQGTLIARGYGESQPVDTNETDLGRAKNRRVTLVNVTKGE